MLLETVVGAEGTVNLGFCDFFFEHLNVIEVLSYFGF